MTGAVVASDGLSGSTLAVGGTATFAGRLSAAGGADIQKGAVVYNDEEGESCWG